MALVFGLRPRYVEREGQASRRRRNGDPCCQVGAVTPAPGLASSDKEEEGEVCPAVANPCGGSSHMGNVGGRAECCDGMGESVWSQLVLIEWKTNACPSGRQRPAA
ncbi:hypothetical protein AALO_G00050800 [Alosa alosa]|uniref:Uncharacterized protein n=1 Tax=Alosa alosa TaxID=278164 RepID=A0AAV6H7G8_9TELE|nr:hypothetical protein AALO_G00050800 [Alosa alosa]